MPQKVIRSTKLFEEKTVRKVCNRIMEKSWKLFPVKQVFSLSFLLPR
jgi:uncharacterized membrane-anchored protein